MCRPTLPVSKQASGNLLKKAVAAATHSVSKPVLSSSLKYDPMSPPSPIRSHSYEEKQQQKELLLQQHRELQKQFLQIKQEEEGVEEDVQGREESDREVKGETTEVEENLQDEDHNVENKQTEDEHKEVESAQEPEASLLQVNTFEWLDKTIFYLPYFYINQLEF